MKPRIQKHREGLSEYYLKSKVALALSISYRCSRKTQTSQRCVHPRRIDDVSVADAHSYCFSRNFAKRKRWNGVVQFCSNQSFQQVLDRTSTRSILSSVTLGQRMKSKSDFGLNYGCCG